MPLGLHLPHHRFLKLCSIAGLGLLLAGHGPAWAHRNSKSDLDCIINHLVPKNGDSSLLKFSEIRQKSADVLSKTDPTVRIVAGLKGPHGGKLYVIRKTGTHWYSGYEVERFAPQGDPTWFPLMGGTKTAYFFGFRRISKNEMTAPDVGEVVGAISELNRKLSQHQEETIGIGFYPAASNTVISDEIFLRRFAQKKALPIAVNGSLAIHDISYHLSAVFLPNQVVDHGARITQRLLDFVDFAKKDARGDRKLVWIFRDRALKALLEQRAAEVDHLGNLTVLKTGQIIGELERNDYARAFEYMIHGEFIANGASPNQYLLNMVDSTQSKFPRTPQKERVKAQQLEELVKSFIQTHPDPAADQGLELSHEAVLKQIDQKRGSIAKAVMSFSQ